MKTAYLDGLITVIIADGHPLFRIGMKVALAHKKDISVIAEIGNGKELLDFLSTQYADVILLDQQLVNVLEKIRELHPNIKVVLLCNMDTENYASIAEVMERGIDSCLTKAINPELIAEAIRTVHSEGVYINEFMNTVMAHVVRTRRHTMPDTNLNEKEMRLLELLCQDKSIKEIAATAGINPRTLEASKAKLKEKLGIKSTMGLLKYAMEQRLSLSKK